MIVYDGPIGVPAGTPASRIVVSLQPAMVAARDPTSTWAFGGANEPF